MSGSYDNNSSPATPSNVSNLPNSQKDSGDWRDRIGDFVKEKMKRLEELTLSPRNSSPVHMEPRLNDPSNEVIGAPSRSNIDPDATLCEDRFALEKDPSKLKGSSSKAPYAQGSTTASMSAKNGIPPPIAGLRTIEMGDDTYRKQVHDLILARRHRRQNAEIELARENGLDVSLVADSLTEDGRRIGELRVHSFFEYSIKMWLTDLPRAMYEEYIRQTLTLMSITYTENDNEYECWTEALRKKGSIHFRFIFWSQDGFNIRSPIPFLTDKKLVLTSGTHFRFERIHGDLERFEDLMEEVVGTFERRWYAEPNNPR